MPRAPGAATLIYLLQGRTAGTLFATAAVLAVLAPVASAATLSSPESLARDCTKRLQPAGTAGTARSSHTAAAEGMLTASITGGPSGDWDLAVFKDGVPLGVSTAFGSDELATVPVQAGEGVVAQGCRRDGGPTSVPLRFDLYATDLDAGSTARASLERVSVFSDEQVNRLNELGFDVTEDVGPDYVSVVAYDDAQRALLSSAGYSFSTQIFDLAAMDDQSRAREARAAGLGRASSLPSGREQYRQYVDYTNELKMLAEQNPTFVRPVVIGTSFEGRPIQGVEIATDVNRQDDGRPYYLNFGEHHAREWPSGEWPMEFARTLVDGVKAGNPRITAIATNVRTVVVPVVNVDGFIASRSFGFNPAIDDDSNLTFNESATGLGAYRRKNCRPLNAADAEVPCALRRSGSGVDLNRNYGYYWGGEGASTIATAQNYRGAAPNSEPEVEAVHQYVSDIHPTVFITNHTFTEDGKWLRQPGFDTVLSVSEDETAMKELGDDMAAATGYTSELGYQTLGNITGAAEDWNYFAQGTYGYTPEARGPNFHGNYADHVVTEYVGDAQHPGKGVREAYLLAAERAEQEADHSVVGGTAPPGATLKLTKQFNAPTSINGLTVPETLDTTLKVRASGTYNWQINPSSRPDVNPGPARVPPLETWTFTCQRAGSNTVFTQQLSIVRGEAKTVNWVAAGACGPEPVIPNVPPSAGFTVSPSSPQTNTLTAFTSTSTDSDGAIATTLWDLDDDGLFDDASGLVATRTFTAPGTFDISLQVTDDDGASDVETRQVVVTAPPVNARPVAAFAVRPIAPVYREPVNFRSTSTDADGSIAGYGWDLDDDGQFDDAGGEQASRSFPRGGAYPISLRATDNEGSVDQVTRTVYVRGPGATCRGKAPTISGTQKDDVLKGTSGNDVIVTGAGNDRVNGGGGNDTICGQAGNDILKGGAGKDSIIGNKGADQLSGGSGNDELRGNKGDDALRGNAGQDRLAGASGDDLLVGGGGRDACTGGPDADTFRSCE